MGSKVEVGKDWFMKTTPGPAGEKFQTEWWKLPGDFEKDLNGGEKTVFSKGSWGELVSIESGDKETTVSVSPTLIPGIQIQGGVAVVHGPKVVYTLSGDSAIKVEPISPHSYLQVVNKPKLPQGR